MSNFVIPVTAEGVLRDALTQLWERARALGMEKVRLLSIRMFEAGDAFRLLGAVGAVSGASKVVSFTGGYETLAGGSFELEFTGPVADAQPAGMAAVAGLRRPPRAGAAVPRACADQKPASTCVPWSRASRPCGTRKRSSGQEWRPTAGTRAAS